jgi:predicted RNA-binding protein with PUA-like domain
VASQKFWLVKSDPTEYGWDELVKDRQTSWDGIRNYAARNHLKNMSTGDSVFIYHSGGESAVIGTASVIRQAYRDPTSETDDWVSVGLRAGKPLRKAVTLAEIKKEKRLRNMALLKISRLSVMPVTREEFEIIRQMAG